MDALASARPEHRFELSAGALCLDFANTWADRERPEKEYLRGYRHLLAFACQAGVLEGEEAAGLERRARADAVGAAAALATARELRDAIYRIFSCLAAGERPPAADLQCLNRVLPEALSGLRVEARGDGFVWSRRGAAAALTAPLHPVVRSAAELLTAPERLARVRECQGPRCTWLFLDQSRNRSRRWCSMETCGNRAKVRRHYRRRHGPQG